MAEKPVICTDNNQARTTRKRKDKIDIFWDTFSVKQCVYEPDLSQSIVKQMLLHDYFYFATPFATFLAVEISTEA